MVRAILEGRKTQTRRVINPPLKHPSWTEFAYFSRSGNAIECGPDYPDDDSDVRKCPYGKIGDRLWVREAFAEVGNETPPWVIYRATGPKSEIKWKPSIHMPKIHCRLYLEIKDIRVERLNEISDDDCYSEGIGERGKGVTSDDGSLHCSRPLGTFIDLWDSINSKRAPWSDNPWVWIVEFERSRTMGV